MIGVKQEFYSQLRDDYIKNGTKSFLYRYMEQEKVKSLALGQKASKDSKRSDAYIQLMQHYQDFETGRISEAEYLVYLLELLSKGDKIRLRKELREEVFSFGKKIDGEATFNNMRRETEKYQKMICILKQKEAVFQNKSSIGKELLKTIHEELLECTLSIDVQTFLYDIGYPIKEQGKFSVARKKDRNLDMLSAYCYEKKISLSTQSAGNIQSLSEEQIAQYEQLYKGLQKSRNRDVVIPVQVDQVTGAGVYIVGKNNISPRSSVYGKIKGSCCYVCFSIDGLSSEAYRGINIFTWLINDEENTLCNLPDLEEALKWHCYFKGNHLDGVKERNGRAPEGCPEALRCYFESSVEEQNELYISEEELADVKALFT